MTRLRAVGPAEGVAGRVLVALVRLHLDDARRSARRRATSTLLSSSGADATGVGRDRTTGGRRLRPSASPPSRGPALARHVGREALQLHGTGPGPAPPGVVRRVTATPGASSSTASAPRAGWASTSSASGTCRSMASRTRPPPGRGPPGTACPCATSHSARSTAATNGRVGGLLHAVGVPGRRVASSPVRAARPPRDLVQRRRRAAPCPPAGPGCRPAAAP